MHYQIIRSSLSERPRRWLVTGCAGFIGSNLVEELLHLGQTVIGVDNFSTGSRRNLQEVRIQVGEEAWSRFDFVEGDISDLSTCRRICADVEVVLHQAALGSVPRSIDDPIATNNSNITGFLNLLVAARDAAVSRVVYAASSSTYGDHPDLPKQEGRIGKPLSPYAVTKYVNELYAHVFGQTYGIETVGLRYFNVFGRRQDPSGAYAAVIPRWIGNLLSGEPCHINGDGETSRDFCYIDNVIQANLLASFAEGVSGDVFNVAAGGRTTLNQLFELITQLLARDYPELVRAQPVYRPFRTGDIRHSYADISKASQRLNYRPEYTIARGLEETVAWYQRALEAPAASELRSTSLR